MKNENVLNMKKCLHFEFCSKNLCILDNSIDSRVGYASDRCRFMVEPLLKKVKGREFIGGGAAIIEGLANFIPTKNVARLNAASKKRWTDLQNQPNDP